MRIEKSNQTNRASAKQKFGAKSGNAANFEPDMGQDVANVAPAAPNNPVAPVDAILALQGVEDPLFAKKKAIRHGQSMLEMLEQMQSDLLIGRVSEGSLNKLLALVQQAKNKSDPKLDALISDIELRARVELAKFGYFPKG